MKFLALGGNLGPVLHTFRTSLEALAARGVQPVAVSAAYHTEAVLWPGSTARVPPYWNAVCRVQTHLDCETVLGLCQQLERDAGRSTGPRWGARPLDLDLLLWDDVVRDDAALTLPHPRLHERLFVLRPLCELAPDWAIPGSGTTVRKILHTFADGWSGIMLRRVFWTEGSRKKSSPSRRLKDAAQVIAAQGQ